jgi:hypothetical protein
MYKIIEKEAVDFFGEDEQDLFFNTIQKYILDELPKKGIIGKGVYGSLAFADVLLKNEDRTNVYIEFHGVPAPGISPFCLEVKIHKIIIYDEIPDIVLDRINIVEKLSKKANN